MGVQRELTRGAGRRATPADMLLVRAEDIVIAAMAEEVVRSLPGAGSQIQIQV